MARPAFASTPNDPLTRITTSSGRALGLVADILNPPTTQGPGWTRQELLPALAAEGAAITQHAHQELAASQEPDQLATRTDYFHRAALHRGRHASAHQADIAVTVPTGELLTIQLGRDDRGWTTLSGDSPLLTGEIDGLDHLEVQHALTILSQVITRHLSEHASVAKRKDPLPGGPAIRHRSIPSNEDR
jgi:hypothetical protein